MGLDLGLMGWIGLGSARVEIHWVKPVGFGFKRN